MIENEILVDKYGAEKESIKDIAEAVNLLRIHGDKCEPCIHRSIREQAYKEFQKTDK